MAHGIPSRRKVNNNIDGHNCEDEIPPAIDGGFGWIVVIASFFIHVIADGITYSFGVIYVKLDEFNEGKGYTSLILSLLTGVTLLTGPISSSLVNKYGCRIVTIAGSIVASACLLISYWATNVFFLILTIGFGVGFGLGLIYLPAIISVSMYFQRYRALATGIAVAGSGIGTSIFAKLIAYFVEVCGWRGALVILSVIVFNCIFFGALFRPVSKSPQQQAAQFQYSDAYQRDDIHESMPDVLIHKNSETALSKSHKQWRSGTLSQPDIFYNRASCQSISDNGSQSHLLGSSPGRPSSIQRSLENQRLLSGDVHCGCIPAEPRECFLKMTNLSLLKNPVYVLFVCANCLTNLGFYVPYFYLPDRAKELLIPEKDITTLLAIIGIANTAGRIILGYLSDKAWVNRLFVYRMCLFSCGCATALSIYCFDFQSLAIYSGVFGFFIGAYVGLTSVILVDLLGLDKLTNAFGLLLLFQGIASFIGPPIVGFLYDHSNSYTPGFLFAASVFSTSSTLLSFIPKLQNYIAHRQSQSDWDQTE